MLVADRLARDLRDDRDLGKSAAAGMAVAMQGQHRELECEALTVGDAIDGRRRADLGVELEAV